MHVLIPDTLEHGLATIEKGRMCDIEPLDVDQADHDPAVDSAGEAFADLRNVVSHKFVTRLKVCRHRANRVYGIGHSDETNTPQGRYFRNVLLPEECADTTPFEASGNVKRRIGFVDKSSLFYEERVEHCIAASSWSWILQRAIEIGDDSHRN